MLFEAVRHEVERIKADVSDRQAERVEMALVNFLRWSGDVRQDAVTKEMVETYQRKRLSEVARSTVDKEITYLLRVLRQNGFDIPKPSPKRGEP